MASFTPDPMLAIHAVSQQAENARIAFMLATLALAAAWRKLLLIMIRLLISVFIVAAVVGAIVITNDLHR